MTTMTINDSNSGWTADPAPASKHSIKDTRFAGPLWLRPDVAERYARGEVHTGPFSMPLLRQQGLDKLVVPPGTTPAILDVCCGSGVTTDRIQTLLKEQGLEDGQVELTCGDLSDGQLAYLDHRIQENGWKKTKTVKMNIEKIQYPDKAFDHIVCAQGIFIIPDAQSALKELYRTLKPGGTIGFGNWKQETWSYDAHDALCQLPGQPRWPETSDEFIATWAQGPWHNPHYCESMLHAQGFDDVRVKTHTEMIPFKNAEHFMHIYDPFFEWVTDRYWREEERIKCRPLIKDAMLKHFDAKYGQGKPFAIEKICLLITARKPL